MASRPDWRAECECEPKFWENQNCGRAVTGGEPNWMASRFKWRTNFYGEPIK